MDEKNLSDPEKVPVKISCQGTDHYGNGESKDSRGGLAHGTAAYHTGNAACDGGAGINLPDQDIRGLSRHNIPEHASSHTGKDAYKDEEKGVILRQDPGGGLDTDYCKNPKPRGIAPEHDLVIIFVFYPGMKDFRVGIYDRKKQGGG